MVYKDEPVRSQIKWDTYYDLLMIISKIKVKYFYCKVESHINIKYLYSEYCHVFQHGQVPPYTHSGILACFFQRLDCVLLASTSRSRQMRMRVVEGWMISSTNPVKANKKQPTMKRLPVNLLYIGCDVNFQNQNNIWINSSQVTN